MAIMLYILRQDAPLKELTKYGLGCNEEMSWIEDCPVFLQETISADEYNAKVMFSHNGFLLDLVSMPIGPVLKLDSIEAAELWKGIDVLILNTWHWWLHTERKQQ
ncbi:hypothetical protein CRYUN_Cryun24cG0085800 [Craigia yunnanensis]